jgi:glyoxylase-like metal-dependent hydrolase (beta-lactamase superfamily II)
VNARVLPPVERLRSGLWTIPVPLPNSSLRYVFVYLFEADDGAYLVDAGWNTDEAYDALSAGLRRAGYEMADVRGVMVTHIHPDHYGLAGRVREASDAWISLHPSDAELIHRRYEVPDRLIAQMEVMLGEWGAPADEIDELTRAAMPVRPFVDAVWPDVLMQDGDHPDVPGWDLTAIWTPGHSPGHLCFWEAGNQLLLSGDHVLPRITPNIPFHAQSATNPLSDFLHSLDKVGEYDAAEVLPAHEYRFVDLHGRLTELRRHHHDRFDEICEAIGDRPLTAWEIASQLHWSRQWSDITGFMRRAAVAETMAHLRELEVRDVLRRTGDDRVVWSRVA